jgi:hypothetical protein
MTGDFRLAGRRGGRISGNYPHVNLRKQGEMYTSEQSSLSVASGAGYVGQVNYATAKDPESQRLGRIAEAFVTTEKLADAVYGEIQLLEKRITAVLRPAMPTPGGAKASAKRNEPSEVAMGLERLNDRLHQSLSYLQSLSSRVDL